MLPGTHNCNSFIFEERPVTNSTMRNTPTFEFLFTRHIQVSWRFTKSKNKHATGIIIVICCFYCNTRRFIFNYRYNLLVCKFSPKYLCLFLKLTHKIKTTYMPETWKVFDVI